MVIGSNNLSVARHITPGSVTGGVLANVAIDEDSDSGSKLVNNDWDLLSNHKCNHHNNILEHSEAKQDNDEQTAQSEMNLEEMVE